jgi:hypothetical protein
MLSKVRNVGTRVGTGTLVGEGATLLATVKGAGIGRPKALELARAQELLQAQELVEALELVQVEAPVRGLVGQWYWYRHWKWYR